VSTVGYPARYFIWRKNFWLHPLDAF
jgi:hypothetical protein